MFVRHADYPNGISGSIALTVSDWKGRDFSG
jgi:hypothetical protein